MEVRAHLSLGDTAQARSALSRAIVALTTGGGAAHPKSVEAMALRDTLQGRDK